MKKILLSDIGGTNVRFALYDAKLGGGASYKRAQFSSFSQALHFYLDEKEVDVMILGVAGLVQDKEVSLTNGSWQIDKNELQRDFPKTEILIINDFVLQGYGVLDALFSQEIKPVFGSVSQAVSNPIALVIGAGTGLGCCFFEANAYGKVFPTEAGHNTISALTDNQRLLMIDNMPYTHLSFEYFVSGKGLTRLYQNVKHLNQKPQASWLAEREVMYHSYQRFDFEEKKQMSISEEPSGEEILALARQKDEVALLAIWYFFEFLGIFAGNMALSVRAEQGIYFVGSLLNDETMVRFMKDSLFERFFLQKGRFQNYLRQIPVFLLPNSDIAFRGLKFLMQKELKK